MDDKSDKVSQLAADASAIFDVQVEREFALLTIRHFTDAVVEDMLRNKTILLRQQTKETLQVLYQ